MDEKEVERAQREIQELMQADKWKILGLLKDQQRVIHDLTTALRTTEGAIRDAERVRKELDRLLK